ncbi:hypothetical protein K469DRAFT_695990 [Zopfia rhizophila CBS 207.26]|uniref:ATP-dependent RNA helicase DDX60 PIN-like domain-containing protein n=1 Tax=Zopfia rhizophila CBS 207.26 TaxID=1314779 RepID=A0A6A6EMA3_9PEZI|nr:hypothetical protein K469DRAFT_695990 [Zopfia rhizophila CBS 207.26]
MLVIFDYTIARAGSLERTAESAVVTMRNEVNEMEWVVNESCLGQDASQGTRSPTGLTSWHCLHGKSLVRLILDGSSIESYCIISTDIGEVTEHHHRPRNGLLFRPGHSSSVNMVLKSLQSTSRYRDSILLDCFSDDHFNFNTGFQLLHASYAVKSFLKGLVAQRCNFHIAFFDQHCNLRVPRFSSDTNREKYLLAHAAIIRHLQVNLKSTYPEIEIHVFPSIRSQAFAEYVKATDSYFIMCRDGTPVPAMNKRDIQSKDLRALEVEDHTNNKAKLQMKIMFRLLIYWFMKRGHNAALVSGLEWRDTKVITTLLESSGQGKIDHTSSK